jgi:hypothetical protein
MLLLLVKMMRLPKGEQKRRRFYYEAKWKLEQGLNDVLKCEWERPVNLGNPWQQVEQKLARCKKGIARWQRETKGAGKNNISNLKKKLDMVQGWEDKRSGPEAQKIKKEINSLLDQDDLKWRQRAKVDWLKLGDRNTKFFHACANQRRKANQIRKIKSENGSLFESHRGNRDSFRRIFFYTFLGRPNCGC